MDQERLKEVLNYNLESGIFYWKKSGPLYGKEAGCISKKLGYRLIRIDDVLYYAHRLAWLYTYGVWPKITDHIKHIPHDNRIVNLRNVDRGKNQRNMSPAKSSSGVLGVYWDEVKNRWTVSIKFRGDSTYIGTYKDFFQAVCARISVQNKLDFHPNHGR